MLHQVTESPVTAVAGKMWRYPIQCMKFEKVKQKINKKCKTTYIGLKQQKLMYRKRKSHEVTHQAQATKLYLGHY